MNKSLSGNGIILIFIILLVSVCLIDCKKTENPIKFPQGIFPDSVINLADINSIFDDYNVTSYQLYGNLPIIFSSNRQSSGGQFDLEQAVISFSFDQTNGGFGLGTEITEDAFLDKLITQAKTPGDDFGPYRIFSTVDGFEYLLVSSENTEGNLDLFYLKNHPVFGTSLPDIDGPHPVKLLNTIFDDAYLCFDLNQDSAYFISNPDGNFDIFVKGRPAYSDINSWFDLDYSNSVKVDSINSPSEDMCPMVYNNILIFTSDRPGGMGGYDLYYSVFRNGNWSSPVNLGPEINTSSNEYRPVTGDHPDFTNNYLIFSSDRPGGKGGFDLYFSGIEIPGK